MSLPPSSLFPLFFPLHTAIPSSFCDGAGHNVRAGVDKGRGTADSLFTIKKKKKKRKEIHIN
jgi:hypothetical protein